MMEKIASCSNDVLRLHSAEFIRPGLSDRALFSEGRARESPLRAKKSVLAANIG
jgi:hypothetical protein